MIHLNQITQFAEKIGNKPALVSNSAELRWNDFKLQTEYKISYLLGNFGNDLPSQACYISKNRVDLMSWLAACTTLSIPVVGLDYTLPIATLKLMAESIGADFYLISSIDLDSKITLPDFCKDVMNKSCTILDLDSICISVIDGIANLEPHPSHINVKPFYSIGFTSGTSGNPKAVYRTKSFDKRRFEFFSKKYGFNNDDKFLVSLPLYHAAGNGWARLFLSLGCTIFFPSNDSPKEISSSLDLYQITATVFSPTQLAGVLSYRLSNSIATPLKLRWVLIGGRNFTPFEKISSINYFGSIIYEYYGTTESGVNTIAEPHDLLKFPTSVGKPYDGNKVIILTNSGEVTKTNTIGTVCIFSYMNMDNYYDRGNDDTPAFIIKEGLKYFITPDQGYLDEDGRLYLINRSGNSNQQLKVYELEDRIRRLPEIKDVALLLEKDLIHCFYVPNKINPNGALKKIILEVAESIQLDLNCCISVHGIPYSPSGKARVEELKKMISTLDIPTPNTS